MRRLAVCILKPHLGEGRQGVGYSLADRWCVAASLTSADLAEWPGSAHAARRGPLAEEDRGDTRPWTIADGAERRGLPNFLVAPSWIPRLERWRSKRPKGIMA